MGNVSWQTHSINIASNAIQSLGLLLPSSPAFSTSLAESNNGASCGVSVPNYNSNISLFPPCQKRTKIADPNNRWTQKCPRNNPWIAVHKLRNEKRIKKKNSDSSDSWTIFFVSFSVAKVFCVSKNIRFNQNGITVAEKEKDFRTGKQRFIRNDFEDIQKWRKKFSQCTLYSGYVFVISLLDVSLMLFRKNSQTARR